MQTRTKVLSIAALLSGAVVFGMILAGSLDFTKHAVAEKPAPVAAAPSTPRPQTSIVLPSFADIAEQLMPGIVSVTATDIVKADKRRVFPFHGFGGDGGESPFDLFGPQERRRGDDDEDERKELSGGTGFIIEPDGYVLTNNHVIEGADKVEVKVGDRDELKARVVGRDPATDLALLKIEGQASFPTVRLGDSDRIRVGEWVMAIGDPLQFEKTVTVGVVSGKGRYAGLSRATSAFENLIQTDAAINFGNSGGPLVNMSGEVIGINTAISRFAQNIGFAVPINVAKRLLPQLRKGKVIRGFLGVKITTLSHSMAEAFELKDATGALVNSVEPGRPGDKAGLKHGDVVVKVDDQPVKTNRDLIDYISSKAPGSKVALTYIRDGKEKTSVATLDTREDEGEKTQAEEDVHQTKEKIGVSVTDLTPSARRTYRIDKETGGGVVVTHVKPVSTAADAGLEEGDVILEVNGTEVNSVDDFQAQMKKSSKAKYVRFYVSRPRTKQTFIAAVKLEE